MADIIKRNRRLSHRFIVGIDGLDASEMKRGPEQHRGVAIRQHKTIPIGPDRVLRVEVEHPIPDRINERRECHGGPELACCTASIESVRMVLTHSSSSCAVVKLLPIACALLITASLAMISSFVASASTLIAGTKPESR
jgi:hypothetical protein